MTSTEQHLVRFEPGAAASSSLRDSCMEQGEVGGRGIEPGP